jgi:outer membrane protein assembly factor BamB
VIALTIGLATIAVVAAQRPARSLVLITSLSRPNGAPGTTITVKGSGFTAGETIDLTLDGRFMATTTANSGGAFSKSAAVPRTALPGSEQLVAMGRTSTSSASSSFSVHDDWPQSRGNSAGTGAEAYEPLLDSRSAGRLVEKWSAPVSASAPSGAVVADGMTFVVSHEGTLFAFENGCRSDGAICTPTWTGQTGGSAGGAPLVLNGTVFVGSTDGNLYAFDEQCGTSGEVCAPRFVAHTGGAIVGSPSPGAAGLVYVGSSDKMLYAFPTTCIGTCAARWRGATGGVIHSSPAYGSNRVFIGSDDGRVYAFAATCGSRGAMCSPIWTGATGGPIIGSPAVTTALVYVVSRDANLYAFGTACATAGAVCRPTWMGKLGAASSTSPAVANNLVYATAPPGAGSTTGHLFAFGAACGVSGAVCAPQASLPIAGTPSSPTAASDSVWIASGTTLYAEPARCATSCSPTWSRTFGAAPSAPAISDGSLYTVTADGSVHVLGAVPSTFFVSTAGSDGSAGTITAPWRTLSASLTKLLPGDTLYIRAGTYTEKVWPALRRASAVAPITVTAFPGEQPLVQGLFWLRQADFWRVSGLRFTWSPSIGRSSDQMVKFIDGVGWSLSNSELYGARSYAALLVAGDVAHEPSAWSVTSNCIHDTYATNATNQDQLIYANTGVSPGRGLIAHNLLFNATNGMGVKLGGPTSASGGGAFVKVVSNTVYNTAQSVLISWNSHDNTVDHNLFVKVGTGYANIRGYQLKGTNNVATQNAGNAAAEFLLNDAGYTGVRDGGGNLFPDDPQFSNTASCSGFSVGNTALAQYGR